MSFGTVSLVLHYLELTRIYLFIEDSGLLGLGLEEEYGVVVAVFVRHFACFVKILHCCALWMFV
jgi:hypothetical protein